MKKKEYWQLFKIMFTLSSFTFGGGYVIVSLMKKEFVDRLNWIDNDEMLNLVAIAQSSPGAVAVNGSILVGYRVGGIKGAIVSILGTILPPLIILSIISQFYSQFRENRYVRALLLGMQPAIAAIIAEVTVNLGWNIVKKKEILFIFVMIFAFIANYFGHINVVYIIFICALIGAIYTIWCEKHQINRELS